MNIISYTFSAKHTHHSHNKEMKWTRKNKKNPFEQQHAEWFYPNRKSRNTNKFCIKFTARTKCGLIDFIETKLSEISLRNFHIALSNIKYQLNVIAIQIFFGAN